MHMGPNWVTYFLHPNPLSVESGKWNKALNTALVEVTSKHIGEYFFSFFLVTNKESIQTTEHQALVLVPSKRVSLWEPGCLHLEYKGEGMARTEE